VVPQLSEILKLLGAMEVSAELESVLLEENTMRIFVIIISYILLYIILYQLTVAIDYANNDNNNNNNSI
jgi:hypothetical protein